MQDVPRQRLCGIIAMFGRSIVTEPARCKQIIRNLCGEYQRSCHLLSNALDDDVAATLAQAPPVSPEAPPVSVEESSIQEQSTMSESEDPQAPSKKSFLRRIVSRFRDRRAIPEDEALWAVESWALALGYIKNAECTTRGLPGEDTQSPESEANGRHVPRIVVGGIGLGTAESISEAVRRAAPGTRILVQPGLYRESVVIDRQVEIIGIGPADQIVIESVGAPCFVTGVDQALIRGLTMRSSEHFTVEIAQGQVILEECDLSGGWFACIVVKGEGTNPTIRRCKIHDGQQRGILITENARGLIEDCDIYRNTQAGVVVERSANPIIRHCKIYDGNASGVHITGSGAGVIERCDIFGNSGANVDVEQGGNPVIRRTQIHGGMRQGIYFTQYGRGVLEECDIFGNGWAGIAILGHSTPEISRCEIHDGAETGILISDADGVIEECDVYGNVEAGALIARGSNPTLRHCRFHDGLHYGVQMTQGAQGALHHCEMSRNAQAGAEISEGASPQLRRCRIHHGLDAGVVYRTGGGGTLEECVVQSNTRAGVQVASGCDPVITDGRIDEILHEHAPTPDSSNTSPGEPSDEAVAA